MMPRLAGPLALCCALSACFADNYVYQGPTSTEAASTAAASTEATSTEAASTDATGGDATGTGAGASSGAGTTLIESSGSSTGAEATTGAIDSTGTSSSGTTGVEAVCGDSIIEPPEACDDGNTNDGDGCSADCTLEAPLKLYVFASLGKRNGNIGPLANADAMCQGEARAHGLPGTYLAWLSAGQTSPKVRFADHSLPYVLPGPGEPLVAFGWSQLFSAGHAHGIDRGPDGLPLNPSDQCIPANLVWTGTTTKGEPHVDRCNDFQSGDFGVAGMAGKLSGAGTGWTENCSIPCSVSLRIYCMQQP
jgi:cysteine-rich repeat protein